jgi:hypothetical protein
MTTPVLDKCVKSIKEGMFSTIHVKLNMFEKVFHWGYTIQK